MVSGTKSQKKEVESHAREGESPVDSTFIEVLNSLSC